MAEAISCSGISSADREIKHALRRGDGLLEGIGYGRKLRDWGSEIRTYWITIGYRRFESPLTHAR